MSTNTKITASDLKKIIESSFDYRKEEDMKKKERHNIFLQNLKNTSNDFLFELENEINEYLQNCASNGRKSIRFQSKFKFADTFGNVKISTLIYGWRNKNEWNTSRFKEIGFEKTPFDKLVNDYKERDIVIKNISDSKKGFGFWIEASFD